MSAWHIGVIGGSGLYAPGTLDEVPTRVVGIMPEAFTFPSLASETMTRNSAGEIEDAPEFWLPGGLRRARPSPSACSKACTTASARAAARPSPSTSRS
mgnify:CR=1 FL=1